MPEERLPAVPSHKFARENWQEAKPILFVTSLLGVLAALGAVKSATAGILPLYLFLAVLAVSLLYLAALALSDHPRFNR